MATSPTAHSKTLPVREPLRLRLRNPTGAEHVDGAWWPQSRDLQAEAADLVDNFPSEAGQVDRLLFSRPDWDSPTVGGRGVSRIRARRGWVQAGSFASDDTHLMVLSVASGRRLRLVVVPSDTDPVEAARRVHAAGGLELERDDEADLARWDDEHPSS